MTMLAAQEDSGRTEAVSRRFGSEKKVNLVDGNGEMAERDKASRSWNGLGYL